MCVREGILYGLTSQELFFHGIVDIIIVINEIKVNVAKCSLPAKVGLRDVGIFGNKILFLYHIL
jgi:hypothetical protein